MQLKEILRDDEILDEEISVWFKESPSVSIIRHYVARENGAEVGFVSVDITPTAFFIYTLCVPKRLRKKGIGSRLLIAAEALALGQGYQEVRLRPQTLDPCFPQRKLEEWYRRNGYSSTKECKDVFTKRIRARTVASVACPHCGAPHAAPPGMEELFQFICARCGQSVTVEPPAIQSRLTR